MPELPDITVYLESLESRIVGQVLQWVRLANVFVLRTALPPIDSLHGKRVVSLRRLGKRIALRFEHEAWLVIHLMIAGRLQWTDGAARPAARNTVAEFIFDNGTLSLTEAGTKHRASLHVVAGEEGLEPFLRDGIDVFAASTETFGAALTRENHTLKRALTDPHVIDGIGNAYSDEILHAANLSPVALTQKLAADEIARLHRAAKEVLQLWTQRLRSEARGRFPAKVTAFHPEMAVHGKFGKPCPACGTTVQRIRYAENEVNYCPRCQTGGKLLADRSLSRLLRADWPKTIDEAEEKFPTP